MTPASAAAVATTAPAHREPAAAESDDLNTGAAIAREVAALSHARAESLPHSEPRVRRSRAPRFRHQPAARRQP